LFSTQWAETFQSALRTLLSAGSADGVIDACINALAAPASRNASLLDASARHDRFRMTLAEALNNHNVRKIAHSIDLSVRITQT